MNNNYVITPQSDIFLIKCPLEMDSRHQLDFSNATVQHNYFASLPKLEMDQATYQRKDERLYFEGSFDTCLTYNYCMYKNEGYSNKWFYAYVTDMRFESNNSCSCRLVTDVFQTWQFDYTLKRSFIERTHVPKNTDEVGNHTFPEDLELGDYVENNILTVPEFETQKLVIGSTADYTDLTKTVSGCYQNIPTGCAYYYTDLTSTGISFMQQFLQDLTDLSKESAIVSLFLAPSFLCTSTDTTTIKKVNDTYSSSALTISLTNPVQGLNGYIPHNNKLYTYPYYYTLVTNGAGGCSILKPELWDDYSSQRYRIYSALTPGCSVIGFPFNYAGHDEAWEEALPLGKYPQLNYATDQYVNWQTQNGLNNTMQEVGGVIQAVSGAGSLAQTGASVFAGGVGEGLGGDLRYGANGFGGGLMQITNAINQRHLASLVPAQFRGNANSGDVWSSRNKITYRFTFMSIRYAFAQRIDQYFDMFGYKYNKIAMPNITSRSNWNFIKTIEVNILGDIPEDDMQRLKDLFNGGFTIWHNPSTYLDYSQTNN